MGFPWKPLVAVFGLPWVRRRDLRRPSGEFQEGPKWNSRGLKSKWRHFTCFRDNYLESSWNPLGCRLGRSRAGVGSMLGLQAGLRRLRNDSKTDPSACQEGHKANGVTALAFGFSWDPLKALLEGPFELLGSRSGLAWGFRRNSGGAQETSKRAPSGLPEGPRA